MEVTVEIKDGLKRHMTIALPIEKVSDEIGQRLRELRKRVRMPGFRPGHVPLNVLKSQYGQAVEQEVVAKIINANLPMALQQESLEPAGRPVIESYHYKPKESQQFDFTVAFEVFPQLNVPDFSAVTLTLPEAELTAADQEQALLTLQKQHCEWETVTRASQLGDRLTIDYLATVDGEELAKSKREDSHIILEAENNTLGFEQDLLNHKTGDELDVDVPVGEEVMDEKLRGKTIRYHIKIKEVAVSQLPELDNAFAERFDFKEGGMERLKEELSTSMQKQLEQAIKEETKQRIMDRLLEDIKDITIPQALLDEEIEYMRQQMLARFKQYTQSEESMDFPAHMFADKAKRQVSIGLLLHEYRKHHEVEVSQDKLDEVISEHASHYPEPEQLKSYYYKNEDALNAVKSGILEEEIMKQLMEQATVIKESMSYKQLVLDKSSA